MSIVHNTSVDFTRRVISEPVHIVQGDRTLQVIAVELLADGQPFTVPDGAQVNIALDKKDGTFVLNKADSVDGNIATFTITAQMAAVAGDFTPEVQIVDDSGQATTGKFPYIVDKAEVQEGMIESTSEGTALIVYVSRAEEAAEKAEKVQSQIDSVTVNTEAAAKSAKEAAESAIVSATNADLAKASATAAKTSETAAKAHLESVQEEHSDITSEISAANTAIRASVTEAKDYSIISRSYAEGGTGTRDGEDTANARYYMEQAQKAANGTIDEEMSDTSTNAVQNKVIKAYVDGHTPTLNEATGTASGLMSAADKAKLDGVAIATTSTAGLVKPDGTTIKIADDGTISAESTSIQVKVTFGEAFKGAEYSITGGDESYTGTVPDGLVVIQKVKSYNTTYTVKSTANSQEYTSTVATGQYAGEYATVLSTFTATLTVKVINGNGATVTATDGAGHTYTGTATSGTVALTVYAAGTYTVSSKLDGTAGYTTKKVDVTTNGGSYTATVLQNGGPFATASDEVVGKMIDAAQAGDLDLSTVWSVGDTRTISVAAFAGVQNQHAAQSIDIVITSFEDYNNAGAVLQFDMKDCLAEYEYMNSSNTGTYTATDMYKTVLPNYANALPSWLKSRLHPFSVMVNPSGSGTNVTTLTNQKLALRSEWEVSGAKSYAVAGQAEASGGKQISYYATQSNRIKKMGHTGSADGWWLRSPYSSIGFCQCGLTGGAGNYVAASARLVAPFGCV